MKKYICVFFALSFFIQGCTTFKSRKDDLKDIFDLSIQKGIGVQAHASIFGIGLGVNESLVGLEDGNFYSLDSVSSFSPFPIRNYKYKDNKPFEFGVLLLSGNYNSNDQSIKRNKDYAAWQFLGIIPFGPDGRIYPSLPYYTKFTFSVSLVYGLKLGFNPGELLDFILGFCSIDFYHDDLALPTIQ